MDKHEVRLVHEDDGWHVYSDDKLLPGCVFAVNEKYYAMSEARMKAKELKLKKYIIVDITKKQKK